MTYYIDPNSGAAPQPGGFAGVEAAEKGHAMPNDLHEGVEQTAQLNETEAPLKEQTVAQAAKKTEAQLKKQKKAEEGKTAAEVRTELAEATANPAKTLADLDEGDSASTAKVPGTGEEAEAVDAKSLETQAVNVNEEKADENSDDEQGGEYDPSTQNVEDVLAYVDANPDQKDAVLKSEEAGKNRSGVVSALKA